MMLSVLVCILGATPVTGWAATEIPPEQVLQALKKAPATHPRLFLPAGGVKALQDRIDRDPLLRQAADRIVAQAREIVGRDPIARVQIGRRLLDKSRLFLERMTTLGMAYQLTEERPLLDRAEREMLTVAGFSDWNPSHFLDVAEMTLGMAVGYDWFYNELSLATRETLRIAIREKGLEPSRDGTGRYNGWLKATHNWNQVCNAGMLCGALAILEDEPKLALEITHRSVNSVQKAMAEFAPDGAYPEGPGYWVYGTTFNVVLIDALRTVLGTDFGLAQSAGFKETPWYYLQMIGPSGQFFNYSDCGLGSDYSVALAWFATQLNDPGLRRIERQALAEFLKQGARERLFPLVLSWSSDGEQRPPAVLDWVGRGTTPVVVHRSSWADPQALYLAIKAGSPQTNHAHMDIGSFVLEADGVRWALDLGAQDYNGMESRGLDIWNRSQGSDRWRIFRYSNLAHNTLVFNGALQRVTGDASILNFVPGPNGHAVVDLTSVYADQVSQVHRGFQWLADGRVLIQDEIQSQTGGKVRWAIITPAEVEIQQRRAVLRHSGRELYLDILTPSQVTWQTYSTTPPAPYDAPNPNTRLVGFEFPWVGEQSLTLAVIMTPGSKKDVKDRAYHMTAMEAWKRN
jgi:hypothetical protein